VISGVTINDKRKQSYDFTAPYFEARQLIAVNKDSTVKNLKDLSGKKVASSPAARPTTSPRASSARPTRTSAVSRARR
jgi:ABC-type amino acid transport substrate-binding protein